MPRNDAFSSYNLPNFEENVVGYFAQITWSSSVLHLYVKQTSQTQRIVYNFRPIATISN